MKYVFSISFLLIYLAGSLQPSWILIDFYWNQDDYTQKYCLYIDEGISQCRASCYLEKMLEGHQKDESEAKLISDQQYKMLEFLSYEKMDFLSINTVKNLQPSYIIDPYQYDFPHFVFHPPKVWPSLSTNTITLTVNGS